MIFPPLLTRVEKFSNRTGARINASDVWAFVEVAIDARQTKVSFVVRAAVLARANMLDVQRGQR